MADTPEQARIRAILAARANQISTPVPAPGQTAPPTRTPTPPLPSATPTVSSQGRIGRSASWLDNHVPQGTRQVNVPNRVPKILGNRSLILGAWFAAMLFVSADEIKTNHWAPRPARLWYTSLAYGLMMLVSQIDSMVPIVNALAIGYDITLAYQFWSGNSENAAVKPATTQQAGTAQPKQIGPGVIQAQ